MAAGSAGEGAGSNTELRWTFSRLACQSVNSLELAFAACGRCGSCRAVVWQLVLLHSVG